MDAKRIGVVLVAMLACAHQQPSQQAQPVPCHEGCFSWAERCRRDVVGRFAGANALSAFGQGLAPNPYQAEQLRRQQDQAREQCTYGRDDCLYRCQVQAEQQRYEQALRRLEPRPADAGT